MSGSAPTPYQKFRTEAFHATAGIQRNLDRVYGMALAVEQDRGKRLALERLGTRLADYITAIHELPE